MKYEEIVVKEQWDTVRTAHELEKLAWVVKEFMSHTFQTMSVPNSAETPFGPVEMEGTTHPMMNFLSTIEACRDGVYRRYGEDQFKQGHLFNEDFGNRGETEDPDGGATEA